MYGDITLVSPESAALLHTPGVAVNTWENYAMGWFVSPLWDVIDLSADGETYTLPTRIQHDGGWPNFRTFIILIPRENLGVIALMNTAASAHDSAFGGVAHNLALLAMGREAAPVTVFEDVFTQNTLWIGIALNAIWIVRLISALLTLRQWWRSPATRPRTLPQIARAVVLPAVIDAVIVVYIVLIVPVQFDAPLHTILASNPDRAILLQLMLVLAVGWGIIRTVLYLLLITRRNERSRALAGAH